MRLDNDVAAAAEQLRRRRHLTLSEAVNELARAGLQPKPRRRQFQQRTHAINLRIDISNVAEALDLLDDTDVTQ